MSSENIVLKWKQPQVTILDITTPEFEGVHYHSACKVSDTKIFIFGGKENSGCINELRVYDISTDKIIHPEKQKNLEDVKKISGHATFFHNGRFYTFGGEQRALEGYVNDICSCDVDTFEWALHEVGGTWEIPSPREGHTMCTFGENKALMFGGSNATKYSNVCFVLDLKTFEWSRLHPRGVDNKKEFVPTPRFYHVMEVFDDVAYVFGGWVENRDSKKVDDSRMIFRFDTKIKRWIDPIKVPEKLFPEGNGSCKSTKIGAWFVIFGGYKPHTAQDVHRVTAYNVKTKKWLFGEDLKFEGESFKKRDHPTITGMKNELYMIGGNASGDVKNHNVHMLELDI